jgi:SAM-dependent methyltransferase
MTSPAAAKPHCPACGAVARRPLYHGVRDYISGECFDVILCAGCGLGMTEPMPSDTQIGRYYSASYRGDRHAFTDSIRVGLRSLSLGRHFPAGFRGRLLDIGCGLGTFAVHQRRLGWDVAVTEIHQPTLQRLRQHGIEAHTPEEALDGAFGTEAFDAVTCWHVLEHALRPEEMARWVRSLLRRGGRFQVAVPNLASWQARAARSTWLHLDVPRHRYHFDGRTLGQLLHGAGFEIVQRRTVVLEYDWFGAIQSPLNAICSRPNVLFEQMTSALPVNPQRLPLADRMISYVLTPALAAATLPVCASAGFFNAGATLDFTCA